MHLCIPTHSLTPGGAERLVLEEVRHFSSQGYTVSLLVPEIDENFVNEIVTVENINIETILTGRIPTQVRRIRKYCQTNDVDVVMSDYRICESYLATRSLDVDFVVHINGSPFWFVDNEFLIPHQTKPKFDTIIKEVSGHEQFAIPSGYGLKNYPRVYAIEWIKKRAVSEAAAVFTLTNRVADEIEFLYDRRPTAIPAGIDPSWKNKPIQSKPDIFPDTEYVLFNVGRLDPRKRNKLLIRTIAQLANHLDVGLVIGGSGQQADDLQELVNQNGLDNRVHFPGYIPDDDLPTFYSHADAVAHPAWVAYGLVPLEAYLMETPVAISTDTMVREVIEDRTGVKILEPTVEEWSNGLHDLLTSNKQPDTSALPTWDEFCQKKEDHLKKVGVM